MFWEHLVCEFICDDVIDVVNEYCVSYVIPTGWCFFSVGETVYSRWPEVEG